VLGCWHWWSAAAHANGWSATGMLYCSWHSISFVELGLKFLHAANVPYLISRDWYSYLLVGPFFLIKGAHDCSVLQIA